MRLHSGVSMTNKINQEDIESITIYSTTTCSSCRVLMTWLDRENVTYTKKMTDEDVGVMAEFMNINDGALGVPFTVIKYISDSETKILGFHKPKFKEALGL